MSNILVTGGLGFIGHNVVQLLKTNGHEVVVVDNQTNYGIIPQAELDYLIKERLAKILPCTIYNTDIQNQAAIESIMKNHKIDVVVHLASFPRQRVVNSNPCLGSRTMSEGLLSLLEASRLNHVRKFVYVSSSMVYGNFKDTYFDGIDEDHDCHPIGQYGIMKLAGELLVKDYARQTRMAAVVVRPSAVYGPLDCEDRVVSKFLLTAMRGGVIQVNGPKELLDFTFVDDAVMGIVGATISDNTDNMTYNIANSHARSLLEAAEVAIRIAGRGTVQINEPDNEFPSRGQMNTIRAYNDFGFMPTVNIEEGFREYHTWLEKSYFKLA